MNKLILSLFLALFILGCAGRKVNKDKRKFEAEKHTQRDTRTDSSSIKKSQTDTSIKVNRSIIDLSNSWRYVAPTIPDPLPRSPVWVRIGSDSIDLSSLPTGSSLESIFTNRESKSDSAAIINDLKSEINNLKKSDKKSTSESVKETIYRKEIVKQSMQWYLIGAAALAGLFLPGILKYLWKLIKSKIKPI